MIKLPKKSKIYYCNYANRQFNYAVSFIWGENCLIECSEDAFICAYIGVSDQDVEFIVATESNQLTDELAQKYGFSDAEEVYAAQEDFHSQEDSGKFYEQCGACDDWTLEDDIDFILTELCQGSSLDIWL